MIRILVLAGNHDQFRQLQREWREVESTIFHVGDAQLHYFNGNPQSYYGYQFERVLGTGTWFQRPHIKEEIYRLRQYLFGLEITVIGGPIWVYCDNHEDFDQYCFQRGSDPEYASGNS